MEQFKRIVLVGFSGAGKTTVARLLAARLGWSAIDTDTDIEEAFGFTVPEIFRRHGETTFRASERETLSRALAREHVVIACGGGAVVDPVVWTPALLGRTGTLVVALDARPETSLRRLLDQHAAEGSTAERPLLAVEDPLGRITTLKSTRQDAYDAAHITLIVDAMEAEAVAVEIEVLMRPVTADAEPELRLIAPSGASAIHIGAGLAADLGKLTRARWPGARRAWIITDEAVGKLHGETAQASLESSGFSVSIRAVPVGESSKSLAVAGQLFDWLLDGGIERGDVVVALGGGVVGDLAGFVAATVLRGVGLVQAPTTLLATVDSSVGGKTGINHRAGKNLIGAFYQPPLVVIDPSLLHTLPPRELRCGWAEIVKHAIIQPSTPGGERADLLSVLERNVRRLRALDEPAISYLIRRNVALKGAVVEADEREAGIRAYLNFGHTLGHAIEAAGYHLLHGEAIAVGMRAAARIGAAMGTCAADDVTRIDAALDRYDLPVKASVDPALVLSLIGSDKKRAAGKVRWVLPLAGGGVCMRDDVPTNAVAAALASVRDALA